MNRLHLKGNDIDDAWYFKSMREVLDTIKGPGPKHKAIEKAFGIYEQTYGVKLKFDNFGYLDYAEFSSDSDLTMFLLRWK